MNIKKIAIVFYIVGTITFSSGSFLEVKNEASLISAKKQYNNLFIDNSPKSYLTINEINTVKEKINTISDYNKKAKNTMLEDLKQLEIYITIKNEILNNYDEGELVTDLQQTNLDSYQASINKLNKKYKKELEEYLKDITNQKRLINDVKMRIQNLYTDEALTNPKTNISTEEINNIKKELKDIKQKDFIEKHSQILDSLTETINNSWVILDVPYISQNKNKVLNGCEAATLLMGLQYKGFLKETNLYDFSTNMPKSATNNAYEGFTHDIYGIEPSNVPHWIAPNALSQYGREASGNSNIMDGTGMSLDALDKELDNNNPVVIYVTSKFANPSTVKEGVAVNLHVMLLTGYNKMSGEHILVDPWTHEDGRTKWTIDKQRLEYIYNSIGKKNVIIK